MSAFYVFSVLANLQNEEAEQGGLDATINSMMEPITAAVTSVVFFSFEVNGVNVPVVVLWLVVGAIYFTAYFEFWSITKFRLAIDIVRGKYDDPNDPGEVSHFQALTAALSATVGLGNIAGVAIAITRGGPGATFWMIIAGFIGMASKMIGCTLGVKYRQIDDDGTVYGGPMYYLSEGLSKLKESSSPLAFLGNLARPAAVFFAIACVGGSLGGGNMFQANQAANQIQSLPALSSTGLANQAWIIGLVLAALVGVVIIGGIKGIARVTDKIVPFMAALYLGAASIVILSNAGNVPAAFGSIFSGVMSPDAISGGILGVLIVGFQRAAFSNEAGIGSASIAHAAVKTEEPASEGLVAMLGPFIDTVVICTMTALVIIITGMHEEVGASDGIALTSSAFESVIGWFPLVLTVAVVLFAFSTMISWSYYGAQAWAFLFGRGEVASRAYKVVFCSFVVLGASMSLGSVIEFSDAMIFAMAFPNVLGLLYLAPEVKTEILNYVGKIESGVIARQS